MLDIYPWEVSMPYKRKEDGSVPTQVKWAKTYMAALPGMLSADPPRIDEKTAKEFAKAYRHIVKHGEASQARYRKENREQLQRSYEEADRLLR